MDNNIRIAKISDSKIIAKIHLDTLSNSFLSSLGLSFLSILYRYLIKYEKVWVYEENGIIIAFVSFSRNSKNMMIKFIFKSPYCIFSLLYKVILNPNIIKRIIETLFAPLKSKNQETIISSDECRITNAELLSISVIKKYQKFGIGTKLLNVLEEYLLENLIFNYKVIAGSELVSANRFYLNNGFVLIDKVQIHQGNLSNLYIKKITSVPLSKIF